RKGGRGATGPLDDGVGLREKRDQVPGRGAEGRAQARPGRSERHGARLEKEDVGGLRPERLERPAGRSPGRRLEIEADQERRDRPLRRLMRPIYLRQQKFFRRAYETGEHGWPVEDPTPHVETLVARLGPGRGRRALDLGCGEGRHTILLAGRGYDVTALDLEPLALRRAKACAGRAGVAARFVLGNALALRFPAASFDLVLDYGCFHHVVTRDWRRYCREVARVIRPRGHLVLSVFSTKFKHHAGER